MKIAISATGEGLDSQVDMRFGRCPKFQIVEIENNKIKSGKTIDNPGATQAGGAAIQAAQTIGNEKVGAVVTGNVGPNAMMTLKQLGITVYQGSGEIKAIIKQFIDGKLNKIEDATGPSHMGMR